MSKDEGKYIYHKHLVGMDCRKDLILENDFTNQRIKENNIAVMNRYSKKIKNNKMRLYYFIGFSAFFSLGYVYDLIVHSKLYDRTTGFIFQGGLPPALKELTRTRVNYQSQQARQIGQYFLRIESKYPRKQITGQIFTHRIPQFAQLGDSPLDVNDFVSMCMQKNIKASDLPQFF